MQKVGRKQSAQLEYIDFSVDQSNSSFVFDSIVETVLHDHQPHQETVDPAPLAHSYDVSKINIIQNFSVSLQLIKLLRGITDWSSQLNEKFLKAVKNELDRYKDRQRLEEFLKDKDLYGFDHMLVALHIYLSYAKDLNQLSVFCGINQNIPPPNFTINSTTYFNAWTIVPQALKAESSGSPLSQFFKVCLIEEQKSFWQKNCLYLSVSHFSVALQAKGSLDPHFSSYIFQKLPVRLTNILFVHSPGKYSVAFSEVFQKIYKEKLNIFNVEKLPSYSEKQKFLQKWLSSRQKQLADGSLDLYQIQHEVLQGLRGQQVQGFLIAMLGSQNAQTRELAIRLLNVYYDQIDWQYSRPYNPKVAKVGDKFIINYLIDFTQESQRLAIIVKSPSVVPGSKQTLFSWHLPTKYQYNSKHSTQSKYLWVNLEIGQFERCGFYDWKLVTLAKNGKVRGVIKIVDPKIYMNSRLISRDRVHFTQVGKSVQGRFIVQPKFLPELNLHEIYPDLQSREGFQAPLTRKGNFLKTAQNLKKLHEYGVNCIYVAGAFQRDNGPVNNIYSRTNYQRPQAPLIAFTERSQANQMLGGHYQFCQLVTRAKSLGIKTIVDATTRVSSSRMHKKYRDLLVKRIDSTGKQQMLYGAQGRANQFTDTIQLNYRKKESWDMLLAEMGGIIDQFDVEGFFLDNGSNWPTIYRSDDRQLRKKYHDGEQVYTDKEIVQGQLVLNQEGGFWATSSKQKYPNPFLIRICKNLWQKRDLLLLAESWGSAEGVDSRTVCLARSGAVPKLLRIPRLISQIMSDQLLVNGQVVKCQPKNVLALKSYQQQLNAKMPKGFFAVQSTSDVSWPLPGLLFKKAVWAYIDLIYSLPMVPMTFMGEQDGHVFHSYLSNHIYINKKQASKSELSVNRLNQQHHTSQTPLKSVSISNKDEFCLKDAESSVRWQIGPQFGFDLQKISLHYKHRSQLRTRLKALRYGNVIPLSAQHMQGWHLNVIAFARFLEKEFCVVAINFNPDQIFTHINFKNLKSKFLDFENSSVVLEVLDQLADNVPSPLQFYSVSQFINDRIQTSIRAFGTMLWKVIVHNSQQASLKARTGSMMRLAVKASSPNLTVIHSSFVTECLLKLIKSSGLKEFVPGMLALNGLLQQHSLSLEVVLSKSKQLLKDRMKRAKLFALLSKSMSSFPDKFKFAERIIKQNKLNCVAFVCPQIGRWSTIGGLGVMVDELSKQLAKFGEEVIVVSPYYQRNKRGQTDYLKKDGIKWIHNLDIYSGPQHNVIGVHYGLINKIHYYFLHNPYLFPSAYAGQDPLYMMRQLVFFAKGVLQNFCKIKLFPSVIVTNDWFSGLVSGYVKMGKFGSVFQESRFIHIVHNLEPTYQGRLYPKSDHGDLGWLNQLAYQWMVDPFWQKIVVNPSRCALMTCDNWGTVSHSYKFQLLTSSPLAPLLSAHKAPFSFPNGVCKKDRKEILIKQTPNNYQESKAKLQQKYFGLSSYNANIPLFSFVGRITKQKGVHLILQIVDQILSHFQCFFIVGGPADSRQEYGKSCAARMHYLKNKHPRHFWAAPQEFFYDGPLVNNGSDFGLMPSLFQPGGIVQQEFFVAGSPVIVFKTGGLKDTVFQYDYKTKKGNGINFMSHNAHDLRQAVYRAIKLFKDKQNYMICRKNAQESVIDLEDVGRAWNQQFYRLHKKLFVEWSLVRSIEQGLTAQQDIQLTPSLQAFNKKRGIVYNKKDAIFSEFQKVLLAAKRQNLRMQDFSYQTQKVPAPRIVSIYGDWDSWKSNKKLNFDTFSKTWNITLRIPPGTYFFKFKVDEGWELSQAYQKEVNEQGIVNNTITVR